MRALGRAGADAPARAVFVAEGLDYDAYCEKRGEVDVRACLSRHLVLETAHENPRRRRL